MDMSAGEGGIRCIDNEVNMPVELAYNDRNSKEGAWR